MDLKLVNNIEWDGIDHSDYPDYCDAHIVSADYDGRECTEEQIEYLNESCDDWKYERLMEHIF